MRLTIWRKTCTGQPTTTADNVYDQRWHRSLPFQEACYVQLVITHSMSPQLACGTICCLQLPAHHHIPHSNRIWRHTFSTRLTTVCPTSHCVYYSSGLYHVLKAVYLQHIKSDVSVIITIIIITRVEIWGRAQCAATRHCKFDWRDNFGGWNSALSSVHSWVVEHIAV